MPEISLNSQHKAYLDYLTEGVKKLAQKTWLQAALASHLHRHMRGAITRDQSKDLVAQYFKGLEK